MNNILNKPFSKEDIVHALKEISPMKAPGSDGFTGAFFQNIWSTAGDKIMEQMLEVLNNGKSLKDWNQTVITLIPKVKNPTLVSHFRPISLCNVSYRIITRVITNRMKAVLGNVIDQNQSAFVPGRLITDNVLIAFECLHWIRTNKSKQGVAALKLDMSKAYDRVEWGFLEAVMKRMGFSTLWVGLIMRCVSSVHYSFKINGEISGNINPSRGLRQGDHLSPYLFVICAQALSSLIHKGIREKKFSGVTIARGAPVISHLFFADDSLMFFRTSKRECENVKAYLGLYEAASGQLINYEKSVVTFSNGTSNADKENVKQILNIRLSQGHELYLGLPTFSARHKKLQFKYLVDRVVSRLDSWNCNTFSDGGKEVLIKAVLQAIPSYAMSCFRIPVSICNMIDRSIADFWWGRNENSKRLHWKNWNSVCIPKIEGGLGFRRMVAFNRALLAKQTWRMIVQPESLVARLFKARYFKFGDILEAGIGSNPSFLWRFLIWSMPLIRDNVRWKVGNGRDIHVFKDAWVEGLKSGKIMSRIASGSTVSRFIREDRTWNEVLIRQAFLPFECDAILNTPILEEGRRDSRQWIEGQNGMYSVASGYSIVSKVEREVGSSSGREGKAFWNRLWRLKIPPKVRIFAWKMVNDIVATGGNLVNHHVPTKAWCELCGYSFASTSHVLFFCPSVKMVWKDFGIWPYLKSRYLVSILDLLDSPDIDKLNVGLDRIVMMAWAVWKERCNWINQSDKRAGHRFHIRLSSLNWATRFLDEYQSKSSLIIERDDPRFFAHGDARWLVFVDAAFKPAHNIYAIGYVIGTIKGDVLAAGYRRIAKVSSVLEAELEAIKAGIDKCIMMQIPKVRIFTDSADADKAINDWSSNFGLVSSCVLNIHSRLRYFLVWEVCKISRNFNGIAHNLAQSTVNSPSPHDWTGVDIPTWIQDQFLSYM